MFMVVLVSLWPRMAETVRTSVPAAICKVAFVCPYGIITTNRKSPVYQGLSVIWQGFSSFSKPKNRDKHNRWRNKTVAFRVSPEEDTQIETFVKLSGLTKQDYITRRLTGKDVVVQGNPRVYKALRDQLAAVLDELRRIEAGGSVNDELLDVIEIIAAIMDGMKEENAYGE